MSKNRRSRRKILGGTHLVVDTAEDEFGFEDDFEFEDTDNDDDDEEQGEKNEMIGKNNAASFPQYHRPTSARISEAGSLVDFPRMPGPDHRQQLRDTIRTLEQHEGSLLNKNYRLAKDYNDLKMRHREESKAATRLTMENMNLSLRMREAMGQVVALKRELLAKQRLISKLTANLQLKDNEGENSFSLRKRSSGSMPWCNSTDATGHTDQRLSVIGSSAATFTTPSALTSENSPFGSLLHMNDGACTTKHCSPETSPTHEAKTCNDVFIASSKNSKEHHSSAFSLDEARDVAAPTSIYILPDAARDKPQSPLDLNPFSTSLPLSFSDEYNHQIADTSNLSFDTELDIVSAFQSFRSHSSSPHGTLASPNRTCSSVYKQSQSSSASCLSVSFDVPVFTSDPFAPTIGSRVAHSASGHINSHPISTTLKSSCIVKDVEHQMGGILGRLPTDSVSDRAFISSSPRKGFTLAMTHWTSPPRVIMKSRGTREARENYEAVMMDSDCNAFDSSNDDLDDATEKKNARIVKVMNSRSWNTSCSDPLKNQMYALTENKDLDTMFFHTNSTSREGKENNVNAQQTVSLYKKTTPSPTTFERIASATDQKIRQLDHVQQREQTSTDTRTVGSTQITKASTTTESSRRPRSSQKDISYAEPSLNSKLRRGDKFYPSSDLMAIELPR